MPARNLINEKKQMVSVLHRLLLGLPWAWWLKHAFSKPFKSDDEYIYLQTVCVEKLPFASQRAVNKQSIFLAQYLKLKLNHINICVNAKQTCQPYVGLGYPWCHVEMFSFAIQKIICQLDAQNKMYCSGVVLSWLWRFYWVLKNILQNLNVWTQMNILSHKKHDSNNISNFYSF